MPELSILLTRSDGRVGKPTLFLFSLLGLQTLDAQNGLVGAFCDLCVALKVILVVQFSFIFLSVKFGSRGPKNDFSDISLGLFSIFHIFCNLVLVYGIFWLSMFRHNFVCNFISNLNVFVDSY